MSSKGDYLYEIETECVRIHEALAKDIFDGLENYHSILPFIPEYVYYAGLNSESTMSRQDFEKQLHSIGKKPWLNKLLYLYDCRKLVASIQECTKEVRYLQGEFYRALNLDNLFYPPTIDPDGIRYITSPIVTNIHAVLGFIFVRLHSLLDYFTKLVFEIEHLQANFTSYPRLKSTKILFGDSKKIKLNNVQNTLFEKCDLTKEVALYRNLLIHDGLIDDMPKVYTKNESGRTIEKFVLFPDRGKGGHFEKCRNRSLFYSKVDKINMRLTELISDFQVRQVETLKHILKKEK